eukprot:7680116-Pyramimonas_sp.AAC.1
MKTLRLRGAFMRGRPSACPRGEPRLPRVERLLRRPAGPTVECIDLLPSAGRHRLRLRHPLRPSHQRRIDCQ